MNQAFRDARARAKAQTAPFTSHRIFVPRRYPWHEIVKGSVHPRVYTMDQLVRVREALRRFNLSSQRPLTIQRRDATPKHPYPHFMVGWDASHTVPADGSMRTSPEPVRRRKPKQEPEKNPGTEAGKE